MSTETDPSALTYWKCTRVRCGAISRDDELEFHVCSDQSGFTSLCPKCGLCVDDMVEMRLVPVEETNEAMAAMVNCAMADNRDMLLRFAKALGVPLPAEGKRLPDFYLLRVLEEARQAGAARESARALGG